MSWQAHEAVDSHSKHTKINLYKLLHRLAGLSDAAGFIAMAPAQSTMAEWFSVSDRTVRNWLDELIASGELTQTRVGSGPGNPSAYQINLPMPTGKVEGKAEYTIKPDAETEERLTKVETKVEEIAGFVSTFAKMLEEIKVEINQLSVSTFGAKGGKGGNERWKRWKRKVETPSRGGVQTSQDQSNYQSIKGKKNPPTPRRTVSPLSDSPADQRVAAICTVCGLDANIPAHRTQAENAAAQLSSYKSDLIVARYTNQNGHSPPGWNWFRDDWRGRGGEQPTPAQVVETISKKRERVAAVKDKPEVIDPLMPKPGQGGVY